MLRFHCSLHPWIPQTGARRCQRRAAGAAAVHALRVARPASSLAADHPPPSPVSDDDCADNMPIAREELYGMYEGNGHFCSPKCCTKEVKKGCQKDDLCIATGCCGMAPCCFMQYFKAGCFGEDV